MKRRLFITAVVSALLAWPLGADAQQAPKVYRVGLLWDSPAMFPRAIEALRQGLRWVEGQNLSFEPRWSEGRFERLSEFAQELARSGVDVIATLTGSDPLLSGAARISNFDEKAALQLRYSCQSIRRQRPVLDRS
jgi:hypothetical protein